MVVLDLLVLVQGLSAEKVFLKKKGGAVKVLALTRYSRKGASSRLRTYQFIPYLEQHGMDVEVSCLFDDQYLDRLYSSKRKSIYQIARAYLKRFEKLLLIKKYDVIWIEKELFPYLPPFAEWLLSKLGVHYIVDFDDAVFHYYDQHKLPFVRFALGNKISCVMKNASCVTVGNTYLGNYAKNAGVCKVELLPTVIDLSRYGIKSKHTCDRIIIGWIGSPSTAKYLDLIAPALRIIDKKYPIELKVVGAEVELEGVRVNCVPWLEATEVSSIQSFDIGVMPLSDSKWERGKCGYKLIQYMGCGIPVVASPVGVNVSIVDHERNGFLSSLTDDWVDAFEKLCVDKQLRIALGEKGREKVEKEFCLQVVAPQINLILEKLFGRANF